MPVTMSVCPDFFGLRRGCATMSGLAVGYLKLDGGMGDLEAVTQGAFDIRQNVAALGHRHLSDGDVAGECVRLRAEAPDMEIVHVENAVDGGHGLANLA